MYNYNIAQWRSLEPILLTPMPRQWEMAQAVAKVSQRVTPKIVVAQTIGPTQQAIEVRTPNVKTPIPIVSHTATWTSYGSFR